MSQALVQNIHYQLFTEQSSSHNSGTKSVTTSVIQRSSPCDSVDVLGETEYTGCRILFEALHTHHWNTLRTVKVHPLPF